MLVTFFAGVYIACKQLQSRFWPTLCAHNVSQSITSGLHCYAIVAFLLYLGNDFDESSELLSMAIGFSTSYFVYDSIAVCAFQFSRDWTFLFHHLASILLLNTAKYGYYPVVLGTHMMFWAEASNIFLYPWYVLRECKARHQKLFLACTIAMAGTYVPCRTTALTWTCYKTLRVVWTETENTTLAVFLMHPIIALVFMSWWHSMKVLKITMWEIRKAQAAALHVQ